MNIASLQSIMLAVAEAREVDPILKQIVRGVAEASDLALARIWLYQTDAECPICSRHSGDQNEKALHLRGSVGLKRRDAKLDGRSHRLMPGERKIGQIAQTAEPMLIPNVSGTEEWIADRDWIRRERVRSFAGQPLIFRRETLGVLAVFSRSRFSEEEFRWLRTFADHAAVAIANARAFEELDRLKRQLELENEYLHEEVRDALRFGSIVGGSSALRKVMEQVALVADTQATVLIQGESGTGKELVARAIHEQSGRRARPFVKVNCGAIPEHLFESEFFGHVRGAFTGAIADRVGRFELAHGGDLFLDEIGEIPLGLQVKLLRVLQEKQFERVGEGRTRVADVRVICATNRDLRKEVEAGRFREDLFYRLTVFPIELPPLRARREDIRPLAQHFLKQSAAKLGLRAPKLTVEQATQLEQYDWPGNVRELENVIERATILARGSGRLHFDLPRTRPRRETAAPPPAVLKREDLARQEIDNILAALEQSGGRVFGRGGAAELLGMKPTTLASRLKALGIRRQFSIAREEPPQ